MTNNEFAKFVGQKERGEEKQAAGKMLSVARESAGLSQEELAAQLKLSVRVVDALEQGNYAALPSPVFVRGYLTCFARQLKIDNDELLAAFNLHISDDAATSVPPDAIMATEAPRKDRFVRRWGTWLIIVVLLSLSLVWWQRETAMRFWEGRQAPESTPIESLKPLPSKNQSRLPIVREKTVMVTPSVDNTEKVVAPPAAKPEPEPEPVAETSPPDRLKLIVSADSWVDIKDDQGKRLIYDLLRAGNDTEVVGMAPFHVVLGYAPGVNLNLNGNAIEIPKQFANGTADFKIPASTE